MSILRLHSLSWELFLAKCAVGARYAREPEMSLNILRVTKAVVMERMRERRPEYGTLSVCSAADLQITQAMLLLITAAT
ncbi:hypothetical protein N7490_008303 [Penicillium lividum]|nr:hypothetical protein N7490_008303 [Penicillium lividum]